MKATQRNKPEAVKVGSVSVKIYRREKAGYEIFEVADYSLGKGKRRLLSFSNYDEARAKAKEIAGLISAGETTAAQIRNSEPASYGDGTHPHTAQTAGAGVELVSYARGAASNFYFPLS